MVSCNRSRICYCWTSLLLYWWCIINSCSQW